MAREAQRGCGYRKVGGTYLVTATVSAPCGGLPIPLDRCPTCGEGIKPTRSYAWIDAKKLFAKFREQLSACQQCGWMAPDIAPCVIRNQTKLNDQDLLIWAGTQFYPTAEDFLDEARRLGISSRVAAVPRGAEPGTTWLFFAHRKAIAGESKREMSPGVIGVARLKAIERIVDDDIAPEEVEKLEKQGLTVVKVPKDDKDHH